MEASQKRSFCCEHVREHYENVGNIIENMCEHIGNIMGCHQFLAWTNNTPSYWIIAEFVFFWIFHVPIIRMVICPCVQSAAYKCFRIQ